MSPTMRSSCATAVVISSAWVSHKRVESSTPARSNVTVPVGSKSVTPGPLRFNGGGSAGGSISLMHASMPQGVPHNIGGYAYLRPRHLAYLRVLTDGLAPTTLESRIVATRGDDHDIRLCPLE